MINYAKQAQSFHVSSPMRQENTIIEPGNHFLKPIFQHLFYFKGKLGRGAYNLYMISLSSVPMVTLITMINSEKNVSDPQLITLLISLVAAFLLTIPLTIKRIHDREVSTLPFILSILFVPGLGTFISILVNMFAASSPETNKHGS